MAGLALVRTVLNARAASAVIAISLATLVTRPFGAEFLPLSRALGNTGQTFPPVAVLAIAVPLVVLAKHPHSSLCSSRFLPIFDNTVSSLQQILDSISEAARGTGMNAWQALVGIDLPLAMPLIPEGARLSLIINIGTATIGSTVAARDLGEVIIAGFQSDYTAEILQWGLVVALIAVLVHDPINWLETLFARPH